MLKKAAVVPSSRINPFVFVLALLVVITALGCAPEEPASDEDVAAEEPASDEDVAAEEPADGVPQPDPLILGTHDVGTGGYHDIALVTEGIIDTFPELTVRALPVGEDVARMQVLRLGDVHTGFGPAFMVWEMQQGLGDFAQLDWGPQSVRYIWLPQSPGLAFGVRGDSDIETYEDLRGKRVAYVPSSPSYTTINEAFLAFGDLTWDDVEPVEVGGVPDAYQGVIDGRIDVTMFNSGAAFARELEAERGGIRWIETPSDDDEGLARVRRHIPAATATSMTEGPGVSEGESLQVLTWSFPAIVAYEHLDENVAYWAVKAIHESYDAYKERSPVLEQNWTIERHWALWDDDVVPLHDGAIRYFEEIGEWSSERQSMNEERLETQVQLKEVWDATVDESIDAGVSSADFPSVWVEELEEHGF